VEYIAVRDTLKVYYCYGVTKTIQQLAKISGNAQDNKAFVYCICMFHNLHYVTKNTHLASKSSTTLYTCPLQPNSLHLLGYIIHYPSYFIYGNSIPFLQNCNSYSNYSCRMVIPLIELGFKKMPNILNKVKVKRR
jgi:hypothetical protein